MFQGLPTSVSFSLSSLFLFLCALSLSSGLPAASGLTWPMLFQRRKEKNLCYSVPYIFLEVKPSLKVLWLSIADNSMVPRLGVNQGLLSCSKPCLPSLTLPEKAWEQSPSTSCPVLRVCQNYVIEAQYQNGPCQIFLSLWQMLGRNNLNGGRICCGP